MQNTSEHSQTFRDNYLAVAKSVMLLVLSILISEISFGQAATNMRPMPGVMSNSYPEHYGRIFNVLDYGAKPDGNRVFDGAMTSGHDTIISATAPFTAGDVGKCVIIPGAGAAGVDLPTTITTFISSSKVLTAANAGTTVSADTVNYGTDNTVAFQAAITADSAVVGGEVWVPTGVYLFNGALTNGNCILHIPIISPAAALDKRMRITIEGESGNSFLTMLRPSDGPSGHSGVVLMPITTGSGSAPALFGGVINNASYATLKNFRILVPPNKNNGGPSIGGIDFYNLYSAELDNIMVEQDGAIYNLVQPTNEVAGIIMPKTGVDIFNYASNCAVAGFKYGWVTSDHFHGVNTSVEACVNAYVFPLSAYAGVFNHATVHWCTHVIYAPQDTILGGVPPGLAYCNFDLLNVENLPIPGIYTWANFVDIVNDSANNLQGNVNYYFLQGHATDFRKYNGGKVMCTQLGSYGNRLNTSLDVNLPIGDTANGTSSIDLNYKLSGGHGWINFRTEGAADFQTTVDHAAVWYGTPNQLSGRDWNLYDSLRGGYDMGFDSRGRLYVGANGSEYALNVQQPSSGNQRFMTVNAAGNVLLGDSLDPFTSNRKGLSIYNASAAASGSVDVGFYNSGGISSSTGGLIRKQSTGVAGVFANGFTFFNNDNGPVYFGANGNVYQFITAGGNILMGSNFTADNSTAGLQVTKTSAQIAAHYDASHYTTFATGSTGNLTILPSGGKTIVNSTLAVTDGTQAAGYSFNSDISGNGLWTNPRVGAITSISAGSATLSNTTTGDIVFTGTTSTFTLPAVAGNSGMKYIIKNRGSGNITLQRAGSDNIYTTTTVTSIIIIPGATCMITDDATYWVLELNL